MTQEDTSLIDQILPWSRKAVWWLLLIQGALLSIVGLFMVLNSETGFVTQMVGLFILVEGSFTIYSVFKDWKIDQDEVYRLMRAMVGITTGLITFTTPIFVFVMAQPNPLRVLSMGLAIGLLLEGLIGLWALFQADDFRTRLRNILVAITFLGLGIVYLLQAIANMILLPWIGTVMIFVGLGLIAYAFFVKARHEAAREVIQEHAQEDLLVTENETPQSVPSEDVAAS